MNFTLKQEIKKQTPKRPFLGLLLVMVVLHLTGCSNIKPPNIDIPPMAPPPKMPKKVDVALVLGAGGSRALAHLGVLEVLEEEGIPIDLIVGCSAGSLMGALYADNPNAKQIKEKVINLKKDDLLDVSIKASMVAPVAVQGNALEHFVVKNLAAKNFEQLKIPLVAVATNVVNNHMVLLRSGPIAPAVHASSALPPVFAPVTLYNETLVDGGVIAPVPVQVARLYKPRLLIAVDISSPPSKDPIANAFDLVYRSLSISFYELSRLQTTKADIFIHPDLKGFGTFDDKYNQEMYEIGRKAARASIPGIKRALARRGIKCHRKRHATIRHDREKRDAALTPHREKGTIRG